jgi:hypothetical protein
LKKRTNPEGQVLILEFIINFGTREIGKKLKDEILTASENEGGMIRTHR